MASLPRVNQRDFTQYLNLIDSDILKYQLYKAQGISALEGIPILNNENENENHDLDQDDYFTREIERLVPLKIVRSMDRLNRYQLINLIDIDYL